MVWLSYMHIPSLIFFYYQNIRLINTDDHGISLLEITGGSWTSMAINFNYFLFLINDNQRGYMTNQSERPRNSII